MDETAKVTRLIRMVALFVLVPTLSIGGIMLWDPQTRSEHYLHAGAFSILAVASLVVMARAPKIAKRFVT
jgi:Leu/Phe-tRNA-protein transferase